MSLFTLLYQLISTLQSFVIFAGVVYVGLFFVNPDLLEDIKGAIFADSQRSKKGLTYPTVPTELGADQSVKVLGKDVSNPFGAMESKLDSKMLKDYLAEQQKATDDYMDTKLSKTIKSFYHQYKHACNFEHLENPICFGRTYFFFKRIRPELQQYSLFSTTDLNKEASLVFDPNTVRFSHAGSNSTDITDGMPLVHATWISEDGYRMAYGYTDTIESKRMHIRVRDLRQRKDLSVDLISDCYVDYTSVAWIDSRTGFFYSNQVLIRPRKLKRATTVDDGQEDATDVDANEDEDDTDYESRDVTFANRLMFHRIGTTQDQDLLVFETRVPHDNLVLQPRVTSDGHYLLLEIFKRKREVSYHSCWRNTIPEHASLSAPGNKLYYYDLSKFDGMAAESIGSCVKLIDTFSFRFDYISNIEEDFWFRTNYRAPNFRVVRITLPSLDVFDGDVEADQLTFQLLNAWRQCLDWIPQRADGDYLESAGIAAHTVMVLKYLKNASHEVLLFDLTQNLAQESRVPMADLPHPPYGSISGPHCNFFSTEIFYAYMDFAEAASIFRVLIDRDPYSGSIEISFNEVHTTILPGIVPKHLFTTVQELCQTKRNVYVPLLISGLREVIEEEMDAPKPCIVCVNGGFGLTATPRLSLPFLIFAQQTRGIVVVANVQGAGIYGDTYASRGKQVQKEFAVQDLAYVLRHLVKHKYTTHAQIALFGGTFNGTLIGSAVVQFPSLFASAVVYDGIFDLMQYHRWNPPAHNSLESVLALDRSEQVHDGTEYREAQHEDLNQCDWDASTWHAEFGGCFPATNPNAVEGNEQSSDGHSGTTNGRHGAGRGNRFKSNPDPDDPEEDDETRQQQLQQRDPLVQLSKLLELSPLHQVGRPVAGALRSCPAVLLVAGNNQYVNNWK